MDAFFVAAFLDIAKITKYDFVTFTKEANDIDCFGFFQNQRVA